MSEENGTPKGTDEMTDDDFVDMMVEQEVEDEDDSDAPDLEADQTEDDADQDEDPVNDEDDDTEDDEEQDDQPQLYTVKVDGKEQQVTLDELQRGYSGQRYIQQGMQEVAEQRKALEGYTQNLQMQFQELNNLVQQAQYGGFQPPIPPDLSMLQTDPIGYMESKAYYDQQAAIYQQNMAAYQQQITAQQDQQRQQHQAYLAEQRRLLHEAIPDLADAKKAPQIAGKIRDVAVEVYGFTEDELNTLADSRYGRALYDLVQYHELRSKQGHAIKKAQSARPVAKAGAKTDSRRAKKQKLRDHLKRTGSDEAAVAMMLDP